MSTTRPDRPRTLESLKREIMRLRCNFYWTWEAIGLELGINKAMAWKILNEDYDPKDPHIRTLLRLPALAPAPVCPTCGEVHVKKHCTRRKPVPAWVTRGADFLEAKLREKEARG